MISITRLGVPPKQGPLTLPVSEVFGPTFQGEGPHAGRPCGFVRLGLCNLTCEWCDTPYTWDRTRYNVKTECPDTSIGNIHDRLNEIDVDMVVLSGGEPLIHHQLLPYLFDVGWEWHVETNGTIPPPRHWTEQVTHTTISPKINTRDPAKKRLKPRALHAWAELAQDGYAVFKFVVTHPRELPIIDTLAAAYGIPEHTIWVMPEGTSPAQLITTHRTLADGVLARRWNTTTRLHTLLWNDERGH